MRDGPRGASSVVKHSLVVAGHATSISLEAAFWSGLKAIAARRGLSLAAVVADVDRGRGDANLSSAIRVFVLDAALTDPLPARFLSADGRERPRPNSLP